MTNPSIITDGAAGAIVVWCDVRSGTGDIYAQRLNASGAPQWGSGAIVCSAAGWQSNPVIVSDGAGGVLVAWEDARGGVADDIYVQRVDASGTPLWTPNGLAVCVASLQQWEPAIASDGAGGALIAWSDQRGSGGDLYAQRVSAAGMPQWTANGVVVCSVNGSQLEARVVEDSAGGMIVTWVDWRTGSDSDIYVQRMNSSGARLWGANGVPICTAGNPQTHPKLIPDHAGGAIIVWSDYMRNPDYGYGDIYSQRVSASGVPQWALDGVPVCVAGNSQAPPMLAPDGTGGAIITWADYRDAGAGYQMYAQRLNAGGAPQWIADGVRITNDAAQVWPGGPPADNSLPTIGADGAGGAIIAWYDYRNGADDIYAQRIDSNGAVRWAAGGVSACTAAGPQYWPQIATDGSGGAVMAWLDFRDGYTSVQSYIYAQRVGPGGQLGYDCDTRNEVVTFNWGLGTSLRDAYQSVGAVDGRATPLGYRGQLVLRFLCEIADGPGADIRVHELGHGVPPAIDENYRVEASMDNVHFVTLGEASGDIAEFDLSGSGLATARYVRITDLAPDECAFIPNCDRSVMGADIDAVIALHSSTREADCANGIDDDGDGLADCADTDCRVDIDGDGYPARPCGNDCDDANRAVHPGGSDVCGNGLDDNCNGLEDCQELSCAFQDSDGDGLADCEDPCSQPDDPCQMFVKVWGSHADPGRKFDVVIAADERMTADYVSMGLQTDIDVITSAFATMPEVAPVAAKINFWRAVGSYAYPYRDLLAEMNRAGLDAALVRIPSGMPCQPGSQGTNCTDPRTLVGIFSTDPEQDGGVAALHELGHAAFRLADEYVVACSPAQSCRSRPVVLKKGDLPANIWSSEQECLDAGFASPCYAFCTYGSGQGRWRAGNLLQNANLMRAKCQWELWGSDFGEAGGARIRGFLGKFGATPTTARLATVSGALAETSSVVVARGLTLSLTLQGMSASLDSASIRAADVVDPPFAPGLLLELTGTSGQPSTSYTLWDPRLLSPHDTTIILEPVSISLTVRHQAWMNRWRLLDADGLELGSGSLGSQFVDYCSAVNFEDGDCWASINPVAVSSDPLPSGMRLLPVWPNPTRAHASIRLELPMRSQADVQIFDIAGRSVRNLLSRTLEAGAHTIEWDCTDHEGKRLSAGVYFCVASVGQQRFQQAIVLVR